MKLNGKLIWTLALLALIFTAGCGGIHTEQSVSPASFFLPGLLKADPPKSSPASPLPVIDRDNLLARTN